MLYNILKFPVLFVLMASVFSAYGALKPEELILPKVDVMPGMKVEWVAEKMIYNGTLMSIRNFSTNRNEAEVVRFYTSLWKTKLLSEVKKTRVDNEWVLGYGAGEYYFSVHVKNSARGSTGSFVVTSYKEIKQKKAFPLMPGSRLISRILNLDQGVYAETLTIGTYQSSSSAINWYDAQLKRSGWVKQDDYKDNNHKLLIGEYQKNNERCQVRSIPAGVINEFRTILHIIWIKD